MCYIIIIFAKLFYFLYYLKEITENYYKMLNFADENTRYILKDVEEEERIAHL